eukprot:gene19159-22951_t
MPLGVVGMILPWNFPLQLLLWKLAPCLAAGNSVIIKPSEVTPLSTLYLAKLIKEAGFPKGLVNVINGTGAVVGSALSSHMEIDKIAFTGSTAVGKMVQQAATSSNLKHCALELGGKSPFIVFDDVEDLDRVVGEAYHALYWNAGQCCSAASRIFVQAKIYDQFVEEMVKRASNRVLGDPLLDTTEQGPQVSRVQLDSVLKYIATGTKEGAKLMTGGKRLNQPGYFIEPTIFANVTDQMTIAREEIFGPVMSILKFDTVEEVITRANSSPYGLVAAVFTSDINKAIIVSESLETGLCWTNTYNLMDPAIPWGGVGLSGNGRDLSEYALQMYTETRTYIINARL